jgi:ribosomal protein S18 acetylase RimI-like enzyme
LAILIEPLGKTHDREAFSCGNQELDGWFRYRAGQDERRNVARVFVGVDDELGIVGFYSLGSLSLVVDDLPQEIGRKLPRYEAIPAALIGRLARATHARGRGIGSLLLADAVRRILGASRSLAVFAIVVDAKDEQAMAFYESFGFRRFPGRPRRLFLLTSTAAEAFARASN